MPLVRLGLGDDDEAGRPAPEPEEDAPLLHDLARSERPRRRRGLFASTALHTLVVLMVLRVVPALAPADRPPERPASTRHAVFLPRPAELRRILGLKPPRPPAAKDRISLGAPAPPRTEPLILHPDDDLTAVPKGRPDAAEAAAPLPSPPPAPVALRPGNNPLLPAGPLVASLRRFQEAAATAPGPFGAATGTGGQMGPLAFDPQGADFTAWLQRFKNEVYRNWIVPEAAMFGMARGEARFEFTVARDGALTALALTQSTGNAAGDRAARNALLGSRLAPLPDDYAPPTVTMQVGFLYETGPPPAPVARGTRGGR